jgi:tRNA (guanine37-N1)-methyltransferase
MLLKAEPLFRAVESILPQRGPGQRVVLLSAGGQRFTQTVARQMVGFRDLVILCGRYEGVDERVAQYLADEEISIGDFVLSGGEIAAALIVDAVGRLIPGVLGNEDSTRNESFGEENDGLLDCPQYTRPAEFRGWKVPEVLLNGDHQEIQRWRRAAARERTERLRPDLLGRQRSGED